MIYYLQIVNMGFLLLEPGNSGGNPAFLIPGPNPTFANRLPKPITPEIKLEDFGTYIYINYQIPTFVAVLLAALFLFRNFAHGTNLI